MAMVESWLLNTWVVHLVVDLSSKQSHHQPETWLVGMEEMFSTAMEPFAWQVEQRLQMELQQMLMEGFGILDLVRRLHLHPHQIRAPQLPHQP
jgi:hypothetical protein